MERSVQPAFWSGRSLCGSHSALILRLITTIVVIVVPLIYSFVISFYRYILTDPQNIRFAGLANYVQAFSDITFARALKTTAIFTVGTVGAQFVLGMIFALVVHNLTFGRAPRRPTGPRSKRPS